MIKIKTVDTQLENQLIYKSNILNQANFQMSSLEYRLLLLLIARVQRNDTELRFRFATQEVIQYLQLGDSHACYTLIRNAVKQLHHRTLEIEENNRSEEHIWLISSVYFHQEGYFDLELNPNLKKHCLDLNGNFLRYHLHTVLPLSNIYAIRLYELLVQERYKGDVITFDIEKLRGYLGLSEGVYTRLYDLKCKILNKAIQVLNDNTDLFVELEDVFEGRKLVQFRFIVRSQEKKVVPSGQHIYSTQLTDLLTALNIPLKAMQKLVRTYGEPFLIREANAFLAKDKKVKDVARSFKRQLKKAFESDGANLVVTESNATPIEPVAELNGELNAPVAELNGELTGEPIAELAVSPPTQATTSETPSLPSEVSEELIALTQNPAYNSLLEFGVSILVAKNLVRLYPTDYILNTLHYVDSLMNHKVIQHPTNYLKKALEKGYAEYKEEKALAEQLSLLENQANEGLATPVMSVPSMNENLPPYTQAEDECLLLYTKYNITKGFRLTPKQEEELHEEYRVAIDQLFVEGLSLDFVKTHCPRFLEIIGLQGLQAFA